MKGQQLWLVDALFCCRFWNVNFGTIIYLIATNFMKIKKNNISLLSSLFDSYLIDKDTRFLGIASGLADSIRKIYGQEKVDIFDQTLSKLKLDNLKISHPDIYNGIRFLLDYKQPTGLIMEDLTKIAISKSPSFYSALLIAPYIMNDATIRDKFFKNNILLNFLYTKTSPDSNGLGDIFKYIKGLGYTAKDFGGKNFTAKDVNDFLSKIKGEVAKKTPKTPPVPKTPSTPKTKDKPPKKSTETTTTETTKTKGTKISKVNYDEYKKAFDFGMGKGIADFESYGKGVPDIKNIIDKTINPKMSALEKEFYEYIVENESNLKAENIARFIRASYMLVSLTAINSNESELMDKCYKTMVDNFKNLKELESLNYLIGNRQLNNRIDAQKAEKIYRIINPIIIQSIINSIPEENRAGYGGFISDLQGGYLTNIYNFCNKYKNVIGIIDSSKLAQADFVLDNLLNKDVQNCVRLILQRIEGYTHFLQTAENPSFVEPLKKEKTVEELNLSDDKNVKKPVENIKSNIPVQNWFNAETIKMAGAFLYQLYLAINERTDQ